MQENDIGQSVDEAIRQFKRLQDDPVNGERTGRALHFLTCHPAQTNQGAR